MNLSSSPPVRVRTRGSAVAAPSDAGMTASRPAGVYQPSDQRKQQLRLNVEYRSVASLKPSLRNARTHIIIPTSISSFATHWKMSGGCERPESIGEFN